jgi:hypothetical protein
MKYFLLFLACALLITSPASAQVPTPTLASVSWGIHANLTNVKVGNVTNVVSANKDYTDALKDIYGIGYGGGLHLDVKLAILSFRVSGDYLTLSPDKAKYQALAATYLGSLATGVGIDGGRIDVFAGSVDVKLNLLPLPIIGIYAIGGGGLVNLSVSKLTVTYNGQPVQTIPAVASQTKPAVNAGVGADISLGGLTLFGEVKLEWVFTDPNTTTQIPFATVGLTF